MWSLNGLFNDLAKREKKKIIAWNNKIKCTETESIRSEESINSEKLSLKSHPLWVTLYLSSLINTTIYILFIKSILGFLNQIK